MATNSTVPWELLENQRSTLFLFGAVLHVVAAALVAARIVTGVESLSELLGQAFIVSGWTAGFVGLLGLYPEVADRNRWISRVGAVCAVIGIVGFSAMAVVALVFFAGLPDGKFTDVLPVFAPFVLIGSLLPFPLFSVATLRTGVHSRVLVVLLVIPAVVFVVNMLTPTPPELVLGLNCVLAGTYFAIGYLLRKQSSEPENEQSIEGATPSVGIDD